jgi:hypothetical protein
MARYSERKRRSWCRDSRCRLTPRQSILSAFGIARGRLLARLNTVAKLLFYRLVLR